MLPKAELKQLEGDFLLQYPKGFNDPEMLKIGKKHKMEKMTGLCQEYFSKTACANIHQTADNMVKVIGQSTMVSLFEKPKFRDFVKSLREDDKAFLVKSLSELLHGNQQLGFEGMVSLLQTEKLAKWSLVTIIPAYYAPTDEVFVKPTTAKDILKHFGLTELPYKPAPYWEFYEYYRDLINKGKKKVSKNLSPSNPAFTGFLMMTMNKG